MDITNRGKINYPPRMLEIRPHFRWMGVIVVVAIILSIICFLFSGSFYFYHTHVFLNSAPLHLLQQSISVENAFHLMVYSAFFCIVLCLCYWFFFKDLMGVKFQAFQKHFMIYKGKKEIKIFFEEVNGIHCGEFGPLCTFKVICNNKKIYRFSTMLERADYIIEAILRFNTKLLPWPEFVAFRNKLVVSDHRLARFKEIYYGRHSWISFLHLVVVPILFLSWLYIQQSGSMTIHSIVGHILIGLKLIIIINVGLWGIYQFILKRVIDRKELMHLQQNLKDKKRNMSYESKLYRGVYAGTFCLCLSLYFFVYLFDLNRYEFIMALENFENYGQSAGTLHLVDTRYNCHECTFSLKHGDVVVILQTHRAGKYLAKIIGFENETVKLNYLSHEQQGRVVASSEERVMGKDELAAITGRKGEYLSPLLEEQIYGKVVTKIASFPKFDKIFFSFKKDTTDK